MKKGFTLVELLGVIAIIAIMMVMATPAVLSIARKNKENMYCKKVQTVVKAAQLYGEDYFQYIDKTVSGSSDYLMDDNTPCSVGGSNVDHCQITNIATLADRGYLKLEKIGKSSFETEFLDPRDFSSMLNDNVIVYIINRRINAQFIFKNEKDGNKCAESMQVGGKRYKSFYYVNGGNISRKDS